MRFNGKSLALAALATALAVLVAAGVAAAPTGATPPAKTAAGCQLGNPKVKHVIYLQFDNVHYRRDASNSPPISSRCRIS
jgi:hypothetical protein